MGGLVGGANAESLAVRACSDISNLISGDGEPQGREAVTDQTTAHGRCRAQCCGDAGVVEVDHVLQDDSMALALRQVSDVGPQALVRAILLGPFDRRPAGAVPEYG